MKTYKIVFTCQSSLNQIPDSQTIFGAICNIIKYTKGESALNEYIASLLNQKPLFVHSSMFLNGCLPMIKQNIFSLNLVNQLISKTKSDSQLATLEELKKYKKISFMTDSVYMKYVSNDTLDVLTADLLVDKKKFELSNGIFGIKPLKEVVKSESIILTRNGFTDKESNDKTLFYSPVIYYPIGTEFCIYVKTNESKEYLEEIFSYLEYFGIGSRRTVGLNVFKLDRIEETSLKSSNHKKLILSKYIPHEEINFDESVYQLKSQIYRASKDYADNAIVGKFTHIVEGSYMSMIDNKEYYGKIITNIVNGKKLYHYAIGFVF